VLTAFPNTFAGQRKVRLIGNPVRADIANLPPPAARLAGREGAVRLLVVGGSLGAMRLNQVVPQALAMLAAGGLRVEVRHQAGEKHVGAAQAAYAAAGVVGDVTPFIADMAQVLGWADLVVCRAGALTIAELAAAGVGSILVPYPHAVDDHQWHNAQFLVETGAAQCLADATLTAERLAKLLQPLFENREQLLAMAQAARAMARIDAADKLYDACRLAESA
jgi:UDP-N-acetylglucosamine--N-acetylmuramyl-(pentapeptide) pyrophosphoryl-undecaprenol N-acetylglucosamine transferase